MCKTSNPPTAWCTPKQWPLAGVAPLARLTAASSCLPLGMHATACRPPVSEQPAAHYMPPLLSSMSDQYERVRSGSAAHASLQLDLQGSYRRYPVCLTLTADAGGPRPRGNSSLPSTVVLESLGELDANVLRPSSSMALTASTVRCARMLYSCKSAKRCNTRDRYRYRHSCTSIFRCRLSLEATCTTPGVRSYWNAGGNESGGSDKPQGNLLTAPLVMICCLFADTRVHRRESACGKLGSNRHRRWR